MSGNSAQECQFFYKVGSCRHGPKCVRMHVLPTSSKVIMLASLSLNEKSPAGAKGIERIIQDVFVEIASIAPIKEILIAANESPHLKGAMYISFASEKEAETVMNNINTRWFRLRPIFAHYLPSQAVHMVICREADGCQRRLDCNYVHPMPIDESVWKQLFAAQAKEYAVNKDAAQAV